MVRWMAGRLPSLPRARTPAAKMQGRLRPGDSPCFAIRLTIFHRRKFIAIRLPCLGARKPAHAIHLALLRQLLDCWLYVRQSLYFHGGLVAERLNTPNPFAKRDDGQEFKVVGCLPEP